MRPHSIICDCGDVVLVGKRGRVPQTCRRCHPSRNVVALTVFDPVEPEAERRRHRPSLASHPLVTGAGRARIHRGSRPFRWATRRVA